MPYPAVGERPVELAPSGSPARFRRHALDGGSEDLEEGEAPIHERRAGDSVLIAEESCVGDVGEVVHGDVQAGVSRAARRAAWSEDLDDARFGLRGRGPCAGMLKHGMAASAASVDDSQHADAFLICHHPGVNNVLAQNN